MSPHDSSRTRTFGWDDPAQVAAGIQGRSGLEFLQAMIAGQLPTAPISHTLGFSLIAAEHGRARFRGEPAEYQYNPTGSVHGGWTATLLDSAMGCAVLTTLDAQSAYTTSQLNIHLVRAIAADTGPVIVEGRLLHRGGRVATAEGDVKDAEGRLIAHGTTTCMIFPRR